MGEEGASIGRPKEEAIGLARLLARAAARLAEAGIEQPRREARLLLAHALGLTPETLLRLPRGHPVDPTPLLPLLARRAGREPLALITGTRGFWTLDLAVDRSTLIPRPDTETLVEAALSMRPASDAPIRILDLGTGTGALLLAALSEYRSASGVGVDRSEAACRLARRNARRHGLHARAAFLCADWAQSFAPTARFDLVLCNPPYVETGAIPGLMPEVALHEPASALDGGLDGLGAYRAVLPALPGMLSCGGLAVLELGADQCGPVEALAQAQGLAIATRRHDLQGVVRALGLRRAAGHGPKNLGSRSAVG